MGYFDDAIFQDASNNVGKKIEHGNEQQLEVAGLFADAESSLEFKADVPIRVERIKAASNNVE